jgi:hypothetical protein
MGKGLPNFVNKGRKTAIPWHTDFLPFVLQIARFLSLQVSLLEQEFTCECIVTYQLYNIFLFFTLKKYSFLLPGTSLA